MRIVVGVTGTSGSIYGCRRLEKLCERAGWESHPILSRPDKKSASLTLGKLGTTWKPLAHCHYPIADIGNRRLTSGSFQTSAMGGHSQLNHQCDVRWAHNIPGSREKPQTVTE